MSARRAAVTALLVAATLFAVAGCGGDEDEMTTQGAATTEQRSAPSGSGGGQPGGDGEGSKPAAPDQAEEDSRGGEKSIEEFGEEAGGSTRDSILAVFDGYLTAVAEDDAAGACSHLSAPVRESLRQLVARGKKGVKCAQTLPALLAPTAATIAREQVEGEVTRVRVEGDRAFVVFRAPGAKLYMLGLVEEGGEWKATTVAASILVPDL